MLHRIDLQTDWKSAFLQGPLHSHPHLRAEVLVAPPVDRLTFPNRL